VVLDVIDFELLLFEYLFWMVLGVLISLYVGGVILVFCLCVVWMLVDLVERFLMGCFLCGIVVLVWGGFVVD